MDLRIDMPLALLLLLPLFMYFGWTYWRERMLLKKSHLVVLGIRVIAIVCLVFALAAPYLLLPVKDEYFLDFVDRSASMKRTGAEIVSFIEESLKSKKEDQLAGIYSFSSTLQTGSDFIKILKRCSEIY
ncbi:VWFA domain-containing protein OS=Lysinibacillus sphaericus OX=1421 GN=LS41612_18830 PE=4 SV=1 [Lysinibacillus sphaericus]